MTTNSTDSTPTRRRMLVVSVLLLCFLFSYVDRANVSVLLADPKFLSDMGIAGQAVKMGLIATMFQLAYGLTGILCGSLGDKFGPRRTMMIAVLIWVVAMFTGGLVATFTMMLVARILLGFGEGLAVPNQGIFIKTWFPPNERGFANSAAQSGSFIGPMFAMPLFTVLVANWGWNSTFFTMAVCGLVPLLLLYLFVTDTPRQNKHVNKAELDYIESGQKSEEAAAADVKTETISQKFASFGRDYRFWFILINGVAFNCVFTGLVTWLPSYLKVAQGFSWSAMGMLSSLPFIVALIILYGVGVLSDKVGRRAPFTAVGHLISAICLLLGAYSSDNVASAIFLSIGVGGVVTTVTLTYAILQSIAPRKAIGTATGVANGAGQLGGAFSPLLIGYIISLTGSYVGGLVFLCGVAVIGSITMIVLAMKKY